jgi:hypothetical protein
MRVSFTNSGIGLQLDSNQSTARAKHYLFIQNDRCLVAKFARRAKARRLSMLIPAIEYMTDAARRQGAAIGALCRRSPS